MAYLADAGLRRIAMLDIAVNQTHTALKRAGYERTMAERRLRALPLFAMDAPTARAAARAAAEMEAQVPDVEGVVLTDNLFAPVVQMALADRRIRLIGFGDESFARLCDPGLSYMRLPVEAMTRACVAHLVAWINNPEQRKPLSKRFPCELVIQDT